MESTKERNYAGTGMREGSEARADISKLKDGHKATLIRNIKD